MLAAEVGGYACRYVQLPINAGMPEAWRDAWQAMPVEEGQSAQLGSLLEVAGRLGVGVFASGPLQEGNLLLDKTLQVSHASCPCGAVVSMAVVTEVWIASELNAETTLADMCLMQGTCGWSQNAGLMPCRTWAA